jgi:hypothetical protein
MKKYLIPAVALLTMAVGTPVLAGTLDITIPNFSFESPVIAPATSDLTDTNTGIIDNWTFFSSNTDYVAVYGLIANSTLLTPGTSDAAQSAYAQVYFNGTYTTLTTNNSLATILPDTTYTLTVALGAPVMTTTLGTAGQSASTAEISLLANGTAFATTTVANTVVPVGTLDDYSVTFTTGASNSFLGDALTIQLGSYKSDVPSDPGSEAAIFDNVRLTESGPDVPEPSTWALMLGGLSFLILLTRRNLLKA